MACAAALANLAVFERDKTLKRLAPKIDLLARSLEEFKDLSAVGDVRQRGFMTGIELVVEKETKAPFSPQERMGIKVTAEARKRGIIIRPLGDVIVIMPPLSTTEGELEELLAVIYQSVKTVTEGRG